MAPTPELTQGVRMVTVNEACKQANVCRRTLYYWIDKYGIPRHRFGGKVLIAFSDLQRLLQPAT